MKVEVLSIDSDALPISFEEVVVHLRLPAVNSTEKSYVEDTIRDVIDIAEDETEASFSLRTMVATYQQSLSRYDLPRGPVNSVVSVVANGLTIDPSAYTLDRQGNTDLITTTLNFAVPVVITYRAGLTSIPGRLRRAMLNHVGSLYAFREGLSEKPVSEIESQMRCIYGRMRRTVMVA